MNPKTEPSTSGWISIQDRLPPYTTEIVRVRRKPDPASSGPPEWEMWSCNVRMHTDEVGWWLPGRPNLITPEI
jgi:hypothetical protein